MTGFHDYLINPGDPPDPAILDLERALSPLRQIDITSHRTIYSSPVNAGAIHGRSTQKARLRKFAWPAIAAAVFTILFSAVETYGRAMKPWTVSMVPAGARVAPGVPKSRSVRPGDVIETDSISTARLNVGLLGRTQIEPGSRVRVVNASASQYRLALEQGILHARIWAPPRFFVVETKKTLAVDLGCVYTLRANADGTAWLQVESGEVELIGSNTKVRVPAGNSARVGVSGVPGIPVPASATQSLIRAVRVFEETQEKSSIDSIIAFADTSSTIVLWHLFPRVDGAARGQIFDRLASLAVIPQTVTRDDIVSLNPRSLDVLRNSLAPGWSSEETPWWKRLWRAIG